MTNDDFRVPFPDPDGEPLIHDRAYEVRSYRIDESTLRLRGRVRDVKPGGLYIPEDTEPLNVHQMVLDLIVEFPTLVIAEASMVMETHPHRQCVTITDHYENLVGLSIARGFTHKVRELFGGPRGCTHTTALLQAMAPVAVQSIWSMRSSDEGTPVPPPLPKNPTMDDLRERFMHNTNTCHVWAEDGPMYTGLLAGEEMEPPIWAVERLDELGLDPTAWRDRANADS